MSDALNIPLRERNVLLLASGYAPVYSEQSMDAEQMAVVTRAVDRMLRQHESHPALVLDRYWNVIRTNKAAPQFFGSFINLEARPKPRNHHRCEVGAKTGSEPAQKLPGAEPSNRRHPNASESLVNFCGEALLTLT